MIKYLLDTHILLRWLNNNKVLPISIIEIIANPNNIIFVSSVNTSEITIKKSLGKLEVPDDLEEAIEANKFQKLPITIEHSTYITNLLSYHRDPFDRLLIAQAIVEKLTLLTLDTQMLKYSTHIEKLNWFFLNLTLFFA
ncbi:MULTISPECIES: type II toxin-antitoxin system VapC family toxin [unclassified Rickettsia]|uniref:type II toxin-antitoxin system VapC family toxin n=1 Tax=unclassified Rickettsia TaxID=114295 RepID=UPI0018DF310C|nr:MULTISPECIES: type II toxin-antitoxin system VapC family toxin [unclassified Rickettsia]